MRKLTEATVRDSAGKLHFLNIQMFLKTDTDVLSCMFLLKTLCFIMGSLLAQSWNKLRTW